MTRKTLILPAATLAILAMLGTAVGASTQQTYGQVTSVDRADQSVTLLDGTRLHFEDAAMMSRIFFDTNLHAKFTENGDRNVVTKLRVQNRR